MVVKLILGFVIVAGSLTTRETVQAYCSHTVGAAHHHMTNGQIRRANRKHRRAERRARRACGHASACAPAAPTCAPAAPTCAPVASTCNQ